MQQPLVSIIMGVYNAESTIGACIESILKQTYTNWEFIICNDCSKDGTDKILSFYAAKDPRIKILTNEENLRLAGSLNRCLEVAQGKYIARMDADDESMPLRIEKQVHFLENNPEIACVGTVMTVFDENGERGIRRCPEYPTKEVLLKRTPFSHPTIMMRSVVYQKLKGYSVSRETMRAEDLDLWIRFYEKGYTGYNIQKPLYRYHESREDFLKRNLKAAIGTAKVYFRGYKVLGFPKIKYIYALKPILSALIPNGIMIKYHNKNLKVD